MPGGTSPAIWQTNNVTFSIYIRGELSTSSRILFFWVLFFDWAKQMGLDRGIFGWNITKMMETYGRDAGQEKENDPRQRLDVWWPRSPGSSNRLMISAEKNGKKNKRSFHLGYRKWWKRRIFDWIQHNAIFWLNRDGEHTHTKKKRHPRQNVCGGDNVTRSSAR